jgi:hypothetical protein
MPKPPDLRCTQPQSGDARRTAKIGGRSPPLIAAGQFGVLDDDAEAHVENALI